MTDAAGGLCVVGMHRSGTSLTMGVLRRLGLDIGPEETLVTAIPDDNPDGYLEQRAFVALDDALLAQLGGHTSDPAPVRPGWETDPGLDERRAAAQQLVATTFTASPWGWKDPRSALLLPFWRAVVPELRVLVCVRNPAEVAASMTRRHADYFDWGHWLRMWLRYTADALADSAGAERQVVLYEDLLADPEREVRRLGTFALGGPPADAAVAEASALVRPATRRHAVGDAGLVADDRTPPEIAAAYLALRSAVRADAPLEPLERLTGRLRAALAERDGGRAERAALAAERDRADERHRQIAGSRSWRMSAPLRAVAQQLRDRRR